MNNSGIICGCARTVVLGNEYVFKIPIGSNGVEENESEIELSKKSKLVLDSQSFGSLGITSLDVNEILSLPEEDLGDKIDSALLAEIIKFSGDIKKIISGMDEVDISKINIQRRVNLNIKKISKYFLYLSVNGLLDDFSTLVRNFSISNERDEHNFIHTLSGLGNYGLTGDNQVLLIDGGITGEGKEILLSIGDLIYEIMNNKILVSKLLENDKEFDLKAAFA